jgi:hypothetical protein
MNYGLRMSFRGVRRRRFLRTQRQVQLWDRFTAACLAVMAVGVLILVYVAMRAG